MSKYKACICEGGAETAIMDLLLDQNKLIFSRDELLEGEILRTRKGKEFETRYLKKLLFCKWVVSDKLLQAVL